jgi:hypothetical protein
MVAAGRSGSWLNTFEFKTTICDSGRSRIQAVRVLLAWLYLRVNMYFEHWIPLPLSALLAMFGLPLVQQELEGTLAEGVGEDL